MLIEMADKFQWIHIRKQRSWDLQQTLHRIVKLCLTVSYLNHLIFQC